MKTTFPKNWGNPFHAICGEGLTPLLTQEISKYSLKIHSQNRGGVYFFPLFWEDLESFLFSTVYSSKITLVLDEWKVANYEDLYQSSFHFPWEKFLKGGTRFRLESTTKDTLSHSRYSLYKVKDGILDRFRKKNLPLPQVHKSHPDFVFLIRSSKQDVRLELSLTSQSLTHRGYRIQAGEATLRENIAQAILGFSGMEKENPESKIVILDPFCGQGTILIEAVYRWKKPFFQKELFQSSPAYQWLKRQFPHPTQRTIPIPTGIPFPHMRMIGIDKNHKSLELARQNAKKAGVEKWIEFYAMDFRNLKDLWNTNQIQPYEKVYILTDPPYGVRLGSIEEAKQIFQDFGKVLRSLIQTLPIQENIHLTLITGNPSLLGYLKLKKDSEMGLKNASLKAKIVNYTIHKLQ